MGAAIPIFRIANFHSYGKVERDGPAEKILAEIVDAAVARGLKEVDGDIVADDRYIPFDPYPAGWSIGDLFFTLWRSGLRDNLQRQFRHDYDVSGCSRGRSGDC